MHVCCEGFRIKKLGFDAMKIDGRIAPRSGLKDWNVSKKLSHEFGKLGEWKG